MGQSDYYLHGSNNVICDRCGFKYKRDNLRKEWNGLWTCSGGNTNDCWEPRHPQDFVRGKADKQTPPWVRPEAQAGSETFIPSPVILWDNDQRWDNNQYWERGT